MERQLARLVGAAREQAREQLAAAWQLHVARVEQELRGEWSTQLDRLLADRFGALAGALPELWNEEMSRRVEEARLQERSRGGRQASERLNQASRRLRQATSQQEWTSALLDGAAGFVSRAAVFTVSNGEARLEQATGGGGAVTAPLDQAPALAECARTGEPVVAARTEGEISAVAAAALGEAAGPRVYLFPIAGGKETVAILYGESGEADVNALEILASLAGSVWRSRASQPAAASTGLVAIQGAAAAPAEEPDRQLRAQRMARVQVAEMRLYKSDLVKQGRQEKALYRLLKEEIDGAREAYAGEFPAGNGIADYLHQELVRTLANDNAELLGDGYPGPLC